MINRASELLNLLTLETLEQDLFRGENESQQRSRLFGGQVLGQALTAAHKTVPAALPAHSLHGYFLRPGNIERPVIYEVERIRDGRSFVTRRVRAIQEGKAIFSMDASFHGEEPGLSHQMDVTGIPGPDELEDDRVVAERMPANQQMTQWLARERPFETRSVNAIDTLPPADITSNPVWLRFRATPPDLLQAHQAIAAYASDMGFVSTSYLPHRSTHTRAEIQMASLDHAMWFHHPVDVSQWLLYRKETISAAGARGYNRGAFYDVSGKLLISTMQEGLMRSLS